MSWKTNLSLIFIISIIIIIDVILLLLLTLLSMQVLWLPDHVLDALTRMASPGLCPDTTRSSTFLVLCFYGELASLSSLIMFSSCFTMFHHD